MRMTDHKEPMVNLGLRAPIKLKEELNHIASLERRRPTELTRIFLEDAIREYEKKNPDFRRRSSSGF